MNKIKDVTPTDFSALISQLCRSRSNAPSISDTFVDSNFVQASINGSVESKPSATLFQIENALNTSSPGLAEQTDSLARYVAPLIEELRESEVLEELLRIKGTHMGEENRGGFFLQLAPLVEALERTELPDNILARLPASASGAAGHAFTSAIRYGACLELVNRIIEGSADIDSDGNSRAICEVPRLGKIRDWQFDANDLSGNMFVDDMKVDRYTFRYDEGEGIVKATLIEQWSYDWVIEIASNGYTRAKRNSQREFLERLKLDPDADPFVDIDAVGNPNRPALPSGAKDFLNPDSIWGRGLTGRLFAQGLAVAVKSVTGKRYAMKTLAAAGATAVFDTVYTAIDGQEYLRDHVVEGNVVFGPNHPLLKISEDSCIDIMFALSPSGDFPSTIQEFPESQRGWCMGRCKSPLIANSR